MQNDADAGYVLLLLALTSMIDHWPCCHTRGLLVDQCFLTITRLKTMFACTFRWQQAHCIQTYYWHHPTHLREARRNASCNYQCKASCKYDIYYHSFVRLEIFLLIGFSAPHNRHLKFWPHCLNTRQLVGSLPWSSMHGMTS